TGAFGALAAAVGSAVPVVCVQNGVENERIALRRFEHVYAICVMLPAEHIEPGLVAASAAPVTGLLDLGRYPAGPDDTAHAGAGDGLARDGLPERRDRAARAAARGRGSGERAAAGGGERRRPAQAFAGLAASGGPAHGCWLLTETISPVM